MHIDTPCHRHAPVASPRTGQARPHTAPPAGTSSRGRRAVALLVVAAALVGGLGCTDPGSAGGSSTPEPSAADTTAADTTAADPAGVATTAPAPLPSPGPLPVALPVPPPAGEPGADYLGRVIDLLVVAPEADEESYERELFGSGWIDADGDRCDTRAEVLIEESISLAQVDAFGCGIVEGDWVSVYDGVETTNPGDLDIDHVVALGEAWRSGASRWDEATRLAFANDLDHPDALIAVSASSNRSKGDRDPAEWQPPSEESWCRYVGTWVEVKARWALTADQAEVDVLRDMAAAC